MRKQVVAAVVAFGLLVVGCGSSTEAEPIDSATEVATAIPETSASGTEAAPSGDTATDAPVETLSLPSDLPADVPIIAGDVVSTSGEAADDNTPGWTITIAVDGADSFETIRADFADAGFDELVLFNDEFGGSGVFTNANWSVAVNVGQDGRAATGWTAGYGINPSEL